MALAIDTKHLLNGMIPSFEEHHNRRIHPTERSRGRRVQVHRVSVYAIVTHDAATRAQFDRHCGRLDPKQKAALEWQAEQGDDEDELEVLHHLKQVAATTTKSGAGSSGPGSGGVESRVGTTTLVANVQSPTFTSRTQRRPPSSFRRCSTRHIVESKPSSLHFYSRSTELDPYVNPTLAAASFPRNGSTAAEARYHSVIWLGQLDFLDFFGQGAFSPSSSLKRRRTINPFHYVSPSRDHDDTTPARYGPAPEAKRFKGVRYRTDHKRWVAEMKPPKSKNKVSFGEFRSQTDAARVVDVAFHHYGRPLNFPDSTPRTLSSLTTSAGLSAEAKLKLVREQTEWMKSRVSSLPSANRSNSDTNSGLRPFSAIGSSLILVGTDEADDAISHPQSGLLQALMSSVGMAEGQESWGVADGSRDRRQRSPTQWSVETGMADDPRGVLGISPEHLGGVQTSGACSEAMDCGGSMTVGISAAHSVFRVCSPEPPPTWSPEGFPMEAAGSFQRQEMAVVGRDRAAELERDGHGLTSDDDAASEF